MDPISLAKKMIRIRSLSGEEQAIAEFLESFLKKEGFRIRLIYSKGKRPNILASMGKPEVLFCSHIDTVPPYVPLREDSRFLWGRGACDTKGVIAAQLVAVSDLVREGHKNIGFLFVVGEEVDHRGAIDVSRKLPKVKAIIVGEPTENKCAVATKGIVKVILRAKGKAAHSAYSKLGKSAIHPLVETLFKIQNMKLKRDRVLGASSLNVGLIQGGLAANIFAPRAEAHVLVRTVSKSRGVYNQIRKLCRPGVKVELESINDPIRLVYVKGFKKSVVAFNTDLPYLKKSAKKLFLLGPGSILNAHRPDEKISKREIKDAVGLYKKLVKSLKLSSR